MSPFPPVLVTIIAGLLIAFALQLLLVNLGIAAGITAIGLLPTSTPHTENTDTEDAESSQRESQSAPMQMIGLALGGSTLVMTNGVLFAACFLAVTLTMADQEILGAALGVVIWAAYLLVMLWLGSTTVNTAVGAVLGGLGAGWQGLQSLARAVFGRKSVNADQVARNQLATEVATLRETQEAMNAAYAEAMQDMFKVYLEKLHLAETIRLEKQSGQTRNGWTAESTKVLQPGTDSTSPTKPAQPAIAKLASQLGVTRIDVSKVAQIALDQVPIQSIQAAVIDYLQQADQTELKPKQIYKHLKQWLTTASLPTDWADQFRLQAEVLQQSLSQRSDLSPNTIERLVKAIVAGRDRLVAEFQSEQQQAKAEAKAIQQKLVDYLGDRQAKLTTRNIQRHLKKLLKQSKIDSQTLKSYLPDLDQQTLLETLTQRQDLTQKRVEQLRNKITTTWVTLQTPPQDAAPSIEVEVPQPDVPLAEMQSSEPPISSPHQATPSDDDAVHGSQQSPIKQLQHLAQNLELPHPQPLLHQLLESPQAGLETASSYLSEVGEAAIAQLADLQHGVAETVQTQIADQVSAVKLRLQEQTTQLQHQTQQRLSQLQQQTQQQLEAARKASAIAAWWLFGTAFTSLFSAAIAGALATHVWR